MRLVGLAATPLCRPTLLDDRPRRAEADLTFPVARFYGDDMSLDSIALSVK
jgi:hypothetical protein